MAALDAKVAQLTARRDQLARRAQRAQRNRDQRTWMQIGRIMAGLGVDSVEKMRNLADMVINEPQWEAWLETIGIVLVEDEAVAGQWSYASANGGFFQTCYAYWNTYCDQFSLGLNVITTLPKGSDENPHPRPRGSWVVIEGLRAHRPKK